MSTTIGSLPDPSSSVSFADALIGDLCYVAAKLAQYQYSRSGEGSDAEWLICRVCSGQGNPGNVEHASGCPVGGAIRLIAEIQARRDADRVARERTERMAWEDLHRHLQTPVAPVHLDISREIDDESADPLDWFEGKTAPPDRVIVYGPTFVDLALGEMEEVHIVAPPVGLSHAEAAVMHAAGVPAAERAAILAPVLEAATQRATERLRKWPICTRAVRS